jgi:GT2 family glycosyltransferase
LDAHTEFPQNYFTNLINNAEKLGADNVGGVVKTLPADFTVKANAIAIALSHIFGVGNSHFRVGAKTIKEVDTVPFGCFRRDIFNKIGLFDVDLIRNQDDEFNGRIIKNKGKIFLIPQIVVKYYARDTIEKVFKMFYQYGLFKPLVNKKLGMPTTIRQFLPVLFVSGLFIGGILSIISKLFLIIYIVVIDSE